MSLRFFAMSVMLCLAGAPAVAQVTSASIFGTVKDSSGAVVPSADVTIVNLATNLTRTAQTDASGDYSVKALPLGTYRVEAGAQGFKKYSQTGIVLDVNRNARVDCVLDIGALAETVSVTADAPLVNVADAQIGQTVRNQDLVQLPLVNRDVYALLNLTPGVEMNTSVNTVGFRSWRVAINGSSDGGMGSVSYYLDGGSNMTGLRNTGNAIPNTDAVQEFRVITNGYNAEFGRFAAGVVDVVTKSGTNALHGTVSEFLRNDLMDANTWGAISKPPLRRNQFGGAIGGPIRKDKLFYFASYSGLRQRMQDFNNAAIVPTAAERSGDFSASTRKPSGAGISNGVIAPSALDPVAMRIIKDFVSPANLPGNYLQYTVPRPTDQDDLNFKVDYAASASHQVMGSYFYSKYNDTPAPSGNMPWSTQNYKSTQQNFNAGDTWLVNSTTVNQLRVTYVRNFGGRLNLPAVSLGDLGSTFNIQGPKSLPAINVSGFMNFANSIQGPVAGSNYYGIRDSLNVTRGRHSLKMGVDASLEKLIQDTSLNNYGVWSFDGKRTGNAVADFMMGLPASFKQDAPVTKIDNTWYTGLFLQDDFRIHPRLMLNLGLRYEMPSAVTDPHDRKMAFAPGVRSTIAPNAPVGLLFPGDPGIPRGIISAPRKNFAPRFGLAWDPRGDGKTSVRAAAGMFYGSVSSNSMNSTTDSQPFSARQTFANVYTLADPYRNMPGGSPFPISYDPRNPRFILPADVATIATSLRFPYTYQFNFSVQRQVRSDLSVTAAYIGSLTHRLPFAVDKNYPYWNPTATTANLPQRRPYLPGTLGQVNYLDSIINADYHGLQTTLEKRMSHGFTVRAYYVWSKSLEGARTQNDTTGGGAEDFRNLALERARTDNDRRHNLTFSAIWDINYFKGAQPIVRNLLNNWSVSAIGRFRSGLPYTVTTGQDTNVDGTNNDRADLVGNPYLDPNRSRSDVTNAWFNRAAFAYPKAGADGNSGRNLLDAPGSKSVDMGLFRQFRVTETMQLEVRAELTNVFNIVSLSSPNSNLNSSGVGTIRTASDMRKTQLGLRLSF